MNDKGSQGKRLSSWKEISEFLGWDERTCLRWEKKLGLPVHRIDPDSKRSRVYAYEDELDQWLAGRGDRRPQDVSVLEEKNQAGGSNRRSASGISRGVRPFLVVVPGLVLLSVVYLTFFKPPRNPADFTIRGSVLMIRDDAGRDLWSYDTGVEKLRDETYYRGHFQNTIREPNGFGQVYPYLIIKDMNGDGRNEVIFTAQSQDPLDMGPVVCFDHRGAELWKFEPGREMVYGSKIYSNDYYVEVFDLCDLEGDGRLEVIIVANQIPFFPTQVAVLDSLGRLRGEYWNSGRLSIYTAVDLDWDGNKELIFGGKNNEYRRPCLVILDSSHLKGGSPQELDHYRCETVSEGEEKHYILFPGTEIDLIEDVSGDVIGGIQLLQNNRLALWSGASRICYEIDGQARLTAVRLSDTFRRKYNLYQFQGRIAPGELVDETYTRALAEKVRYHEGREWVKRPFPGSARSSRRPGREPRE